MNTHGLNKREEHSIVTRIGLSKKANTLTWSTFSCSNWYTTANYQCTRSVPWTTLQTYSQNMSLQKFSTNTFTTLGFCQTATSTSVATASQASKQTVSHPHQQARCVYNTYIRSWRHGITIQYLLYHSELRQYVDFWMVETFWFYNLLLHEKSTMWSFNNGWKWQSWMKQFLLHGFPNAFEDNFLLPPEQFLLRKQLRRQSPFCLQGENNGLDWGPGLQDFGHTSVRKYNFKTILVPKDCELSWNNFFDNDKTYWSQWWHGKNTIRSWMRTICHNICQEDCVRAVDGDNSSSSQQQRKPWHSGRITRHKGISKRQLRMSLSLLNQRPSTWPITMGKSAPTTSSEDNLSNSY